MEKIKIKIELLKTKSDILKSKLLLFSGAFGGSATLIFGSNSTLFKMLFLSSSLLSLIAIVINLSKISEIYNKLNSLEKDLDND